METIATSGLFDGPAEVPSGTIDHQLKRAGGLVTADLTDAAEVLLNLVEGWKRLVAKMGRPGQRVGIGECL